MTVYGDGKQTRSFQYVSDLVLTPCFLCFFLYAEVSVIFIQNYTE
jgi:nucleoside-diphosphate-sugar epimerase